MEVMEIVKVYGPLGLGWIIAGYLLKFILDRYNADIESRVQLALALDKLSNVVDSLTRKD